MKKQIAFLLTAALTVASMAVPVLADDAPATEAQGVSGTSDETLVVALAEEPASLMPVSHAGKYAGCVTDCTNEMLFKWDLETGEVVPNIASYEWVDDTHFRITIEDGVCFSDGTPLTSDDILYSFTESAKLSPGDMAIFNLDNAKVEDDQNLVMETKSVWPQAPERLVQDIYPIYNKATWESQGGAETTDLYPNGAWGTGKYVFDEWEPGQYITVTRNENYWNKDDMGYYKTIKFVFISDESARAMAVESGDVNVACDLSPSQAAIYDGNPNAEVHYLDTRLAGCLELNTQHNEALQDVRVRKAIYDLVDVNALNMLAANGKGAIGETSISPYSEVFTQVGGERAVNVDEAKELLAEAGYGDGLTLDFVIMANQQQIGEMIQANLAEGGITVNLGVHEIPTHFQMLMAGDYDMHYGDFSASYYTENIRLNDGRIDFSEVAGGSGYQNEDWYKIADRCYNAIDMDERMDAYKEAQQYMYDNALCVGTMTTIFMYLETPGLTTPNVTGEGWADITSIKPVA